MLLTWPHEHSDWVGELETLKTFYAELCAASRHTSP